MLYRSRVFSPLYLVQVCMYFGICTKDQSAKVMYLSFYQLTFLKKKLTFSIKKGNLGVFTNKLFILFLSAFSNTITIKIFLPSLNNKIVRNS